MNIGVDIKAFKNGKTGIYRYLKSILDYLQEYDTTNNYILFETLSSEYELKNPRWKIVSTGWWKWLGFLWEQLYLPGLLRKHRIDVLWAPEQIAPIFASKATRIVTTVHDNVNIYFPETMAMGPRLILDYLFPHVIKRSDGLVIISNYVKNELLEHYPKQCDGKNMKMVHNGCPNWTLPENYSANEREDFLLYIGNPEPRKNLVRIIKALELLYEEDGISIPFHLIGPKESWKTDALTQTLNSSPIKDNIKILGYLSEEELVEQYTKCKAVVYPSLYEGFGLPVLEALQLDAVVLTSKGTVMEEVAQECAVYTNPHDANDIADKIKTIISDSFDRDSVLKNKEKVLAMFSWEKTAKAVHDYFMEIARK